MAGIRLLFLGIFVATLSLTSGSALAQDYSVDAERCEAPISTCRIGPVPLDPSRPEVYPGPDITPFPQSDCPKGFECVCVPSCPNCKNCAAQVCVPAPEPECKTACDCASGMGCLNGRCDRSLAPQVPVFCCDSGQCPGEAQCQHRDGTFDTCRPLIDPICEIRRQKAARAVDHVVEKSNYCRAAKDCVEINIDTRCGGRCPAYVNRSRADGASKRIDRIDRRICSDYDQLHCGYSLPGCLVTQPACIDHKCVGIGLPSPPIPRPIDSVITPHDGQILDLQRR